MLEKTFIQIDREIITKINDTTEAIILSYIIHEQISSMRNSKNIRRITNKEIAQRFGISEKTVSRVKEKLYEKNLIVANSPYPNPRVGKLNWNENDKCFDLCKYISYEDGTNAQRIVYLISAIDEKVDYFDYGFVKVDKEWFENPEIDITTKYWVIFFKAFEPKKDWIPTWKGIEKNSCWSAASIRDAYYRIRDDGWVHNDKEVDIELDYQRYMGKSYNIDFSQTRDEEVFEQSEGTEKQIQEMICDFNVSIKEPEQKEEVPSDLYDWMETIAI